jgi:F0F1-type ATP synthase assembly protein I
MVDKPKDELRERPLPELLRELSQQMATLVRQEIDLAKAEITEKGKTAGLGAGMFGAAGVMGLATLGAFTGFLILVLSVALSPWLSALIVTVLYAIIAGVLALQGRRKVKQATPPVPEQTVESVKEDIRWAKDQKRSAGR